LWGAVGGKLDVEQSHEPAQAELGRGTPI